MEGKFALLVSGASYPAIFLQVIFFSSCSSLMARLNVRLFPKPSTAKVRGISTLLGVEIRGCPQERILSCSLSGGTISSPLSSALGGGSGIFFSAPRPRMDRAPVGLTSPAGLRAGPGGIRVGFGASGEISFSTRKAGVLPNGPLGVARGGGGSG
jgi:hypothetical protein